MRIPVNPTLGSVFIRPRVPLQSDPSTLGIIARWVEATISQ